MNMYKFWCIWQFWAAKVFIISQPKKEKKIGNGGNHPGKCNTEKNKRFIFDRWKVTNYPITSVPFSLEEYAILCCLFTTFVTWQPTLDFTILKDTKKKKPTKITSFNTERSCHIISLNAKILPSHPHFQFAEEILILPVNYLIVFLIIIKL